MPAKTKSWATIAAVIAVSLAACDARSTNAATPASAKPQAAPRMPPPAVHDALKAQNAVADYDQSSAEVIRRYGSYQYHSADWRPTLRQFAQWVEQAGGYSRFGVDTETGNVVVFMQLTWTYEDGSPADYGFVLVPNPRSGEAALMQAYRGEVRMSDNDAEGVLSGVVLDMYHRGMLPPV